MRHAVLRVRYAERMHISQSEAELEPNEYIEQALLVWSIDAANAKVKAKVGEVTGP